MAVTKEQLEWTFELDRCTNDFEYLCAKYLHIKSKTVIGFPTLKLNTVQRFLWGKIKEQWEREGYVRQVWGKSRQIGSSSLVHALNFWRTNFHDYHNSFIIAHDEPSAYEQFDKIKTFYDALPVPLQSVTKYWAKGKIDFEDRRSRILCGHARNINVGAGDMNHFLHMTEAARYPNAEQVQTSIFPSISEAKGDDPSFIIIESTSFFGGDWFKSFAEDAQAGRNGFEFHFVPYYMHDDYKRKLPHDFRLTEEERQMLRDYPLMTPENICWRRHKRSEYASNPVMFEQEYPISWEQSWILPSGTSNTFDGVRLDEFADGLKPGRRAFVTNKGLNFSIGGTLEVWEEPVDGCFYDIGIDIAEGRTEAADWTVLEVVRRDTLEQVAEARGHWDPAGEEFLDLCYWTGMTYNRGQMIPDITGGWGHALLSDLQKRDYPNLWQWRRRDDAKERVSNRVGFLYTHRDKALLVNNAVRVVTRETPKIHSDILIEEMRHFLTIGIDEWGAAPGYKDDCLFEGTLVKTDIGYQPIESVQVGDRVFTHLGRYREVTKCIKKSFEADAFEMKFAGQLPLTVTYNHPVLSTRRSQERGLTSTFTRRDWTLPDQWMKHYRAIAVREALLPCPHIVMTDDMFVGENTRAVKIGLRQITLDESFAKLLGRFLADGHRKKNYGHATWVVELAFNVTDESWQQFNEYVKSLGISTQTSIAKNCRKLLFGSRLLWYLFDLCYRDGEKVVPPYFAQLGDALDNVLEEWLKGDGWWHRKAGEVIGATTSHALALDMRDIALAVGKGASLSLHQRYRYEVKTKDQYWLRVWEGARRQDHIRQISDYEFAAATQSVTRSWKRADVYNLEVDEDESFVAEGIIVHNCVNAWALALMGAIDEGRRGAPEMKPVPKPFKEKCFYHDIDEDMDTNKNLSGDFVARFAKSGVRDRSSY